MLSKGERECQIVITKLADNKDQSQEREKQQSIMTNNENELSSATLDSCGPNVIRVSVRVFTVRIT